MEFINQLIKGDTLSTLLSMPDNIVNLGITSPPYNKQENNSGWLVTNVTYDNYVDSIPENEYQNNQIDILNELYRITIPGGSFFYNHKLRWEQGKLYYPMEWIHKTLWTIKQEIIWDRILAANIRGWRFWQVDERIYWLYKPISNKIIGKELESSDAKLTSIWRGPPDGHNIHPAPFPIWIPARIIISLLKNSINGLVIDPYVGSGTTAVAASLLGHNYIGIDCSADYLQIAHDRLNNKYIEIIKIQEELELHKVKTSFEKRKILKMNVGKHRNTDIFQKELF